MSLTRFRVKYSDSGRRGGGVVATAALGLWPNHKTIFITAVAPAQNLPQGHRQALAGGDRLPHNMLLLQPAAYKAVELIKKLGCHAVVLKKEVGILVLHDLKLHIQEISIKLLHIHVERKMRDAYQSIILALLPSVLPRSSHPHRPAV